MLSITRFATFMFYLCGVRQVRFKNRYLTVFHTWVMFISVLKCNVLHQIQYHACEPVWYWGILDYSRHVSLLGVKTWLSTLEIVYISVSFGGDTKSRWSLLSGVYARGSKISHQSALEMCNLWTPHSNLEKDNSLNHSCVSPSMGCLEYT